MPMILAPLDETPPPIGYQRHVSPAERLHRMNFASAKLQFQYEQWARVMAFRGHSWCISQVWRSEAEQTYLYMSGRTRPGPIITNATARQSRHCDMCNGEPASNAVDVVPIINGVPTFATDRTTSAFYSSMRDAARLAGLFWGGEFKALAGDYGHLQCVNPETKPK